LIEKTVLTHQFLLLLETHQFNLFTLIRHLFVNVQNYSLSYMFTAMSHT